MTDARFCHVHMSDAQIRMLDFADGDEREGFGRLPGFDEAIEVPHHLEPQRVDEEETLPTEMHPSYPLGRPLYSSSGGARAAGSKGLMSMWSSREVGLGFGTKNATILHNTWPELGLLAESKDGGFLGGIIEAEPKREVPPQMAGAKRPPSPPPPALFVHEVHQRVNDLARPNGIPVIPPPNYDPPRHRQADSSGLSGAIDEHTMDMLVEEEEVLQDDDPFPSRPGPSRPRPAPRPRFSGSHRRTSTSSRSLSQSQSLLDESLEEASHDYNRSTSTEGSRRRSARLSRGMTEESLASISTGVSATGRPRRAAAIAAVASMRSNG